jgi:hypothetical protein
MECLARQSCNKPLWRADENDADENDGIVPQQRRYIQGNASNVAIEFETLGDDDKDNTDVSFTQVGPRVASIRRSAFTEPRSKVYNITVSTNSSDGSYLAVDRVTIYSSVPRESVDHCPIPTRRRGTTVIRSRLPIQLSRLIDVKSRKPSSILRATVHLIPTMVRYRRTRSRTL